MTSELNAIQPDKLLEMTSNILDDNLKMIIQSIIIQQNEIRQSNNEYNSTFQNQSNTLKTVFSSTNSIKKREENGNNTSDIINKEIMNQIDYKFHQITQRLDSNEKEIHLLKLSTLETINNNHEEETFPVISSIRCQSNNSRNSFKFNSEKLLLATCDFNIPGKDSTINHFQELPRMNSIHDLINNVKKTISYSSVKQNNELRLNNYYQLNETEQNPVMCCFRNNSIKRRNRNISKNTISSNNKIDKDNHYISSIDYLSKEIKVIKVLLNEKSKISQYIEITNLIEGIMTNIYLLRRQFDEHIIESSKKYELLNESILSDSLQQTNNIKEDVANVNIMNKKKIRNIKEEMLSNQATIDNS